MNALDAGRWRDAGALFDVFIELEPALREQRLAELEAGDPALGRLVRELLAADADDGLLDAAAVAAVPSAAPELPALTVPQTIDQYRVVRALGHGGMGEVWLAERNDGQYEQLVAIKLLKRGMNSAAIVRRFLQERRILARLTHPSIAHLIDGGMSAEGLPYFVMEYVDGVPITTWCRDRELDLTARITLFLDVCDAVEYAHRNLVVHRDLKPSNILVDVDGRPKLLDFGIAKLLGDSSSADATMTETGMRPMTPAYAAPEQICGEPVTTATDVYALGVVLYELVTGRLPHQRGARSVEALQRSLDGESIERPSSALRRTGDSSGVSGTQSRWNLSRGLQSDLDTIVLKALKREPDRRYHSAAALIDDLTRFLDGRPIAARPDSSGYRFRKFVGRHRAGAAAVAVALLALVVGFGVAVWQAQAAREAAARADVQARQAQRTKTFVVSMLRDLSPESGGGKAQPSAVDLLERAAKRLDEELGDLPEARGELAFAIASGLKELGQHRSALPMADAAVDGLRGVPERAGELASALQLRAMVRDALGDLDAAEADARESLALFLQQGDAARLAVIQIRTTLAKQANRRARYAEGRALHRAILADRTALFGPDDPRLAVDWNNLGSDALVVDAFRDAEVAYRNAARLLEKGGMGRSPPRALVHGGLAVALMAQARYDEATAELDAATAIQAQSLPPTHPDAANTHVLRGNLLRRQGRLDEAESELRTALVVFEQLGHPTQGNAELLLANVLAERGRFADAAQLAAKADAHLSAKRVALDAPTLYARATHAWTRAAQGEAGAERDLRDVIAEFERLALDDQEEYGQAALWLAGVLEARGETAEAAQWRTRARDAWARLLGNDHPRVVALRR